MPSDARITDLPSEELETRICEQAAHIAAATYRWLRLVAEFDRRRSWAEWGTKSAAHWLSWRCGIELHTAREHVRVARALDDLDLICEAFSRGELSYSKVRALTRIATPHTERELVEFARHGTAQHVEKMVRGYRSCLPAEDAEASYRERTVTWRRNDDGSAEIKIKAPAEEVELFLEALNKVADELAKTNRVPEQAYGEAAQWRRDRADAVVEMARRELAGDRPSSSSADRYLVYVHTDVDAVLYGTGINHLECGSGIATEATMRLLCDASMVGVIKDADGNVLDIGRRTRKISPSLRRALQIRDGGCVFPGCSNTLFVDGHHIKHWIIGGKTALQNLVLLCPFHHRVIHQPGFSMKIEPDGRFTFMRPGGEVIETAPLVVEPGGVEEKNAELGLHIDALTSVAKWAGEQCRYDVAVEYLLRKNHPEMYEPKSVPAETDPFMLELQFKLEDLERQDREARIARAYAG